MFWFVWSWIVPIDRSHRSQSYLVRCQLIMLHYDNEAIDCIIKKKSFSHSRGWMLNISVCIWIIVIVRSSFCRFHIQLQNVTVFFLHRRTAAHGWKVCETHNVAHRSSHTCIKHKTHVISESPSNPSFRMPFECDIFDFIVVRRSSLSLFSAKKLINIYKFVVRAPAD